MEVTSDSCWRSFDRHSLLAVLFVIVLPLFLNHSLWFEVLGGIRPQAWDGSGHYALAQIYNHSIFPETFGWTNAYFAGLGFPNFYPPLFYFLVALLAHTHLVSLAVAFKIVLVLPMLLLPAAVWWLAYRLGGRHRIAATCAALALMPLLIDYRFTNSSGVIGLSHTSTFLLGLYTQPLGFVLLMVWYVIYVECGNSLPFSKAATSRRPPKYFVLSSILLALALLANFFSSNVAALMVITVVAYDLFKRDRGFIAHLAIPVVALCLMLFWLAPLISSYRFVVTRPVRTPLAELLLPVMWPWYALAALGGWLWVRRTREGAHVPFLLMCALLFLAICLGGTIAPRWFPFQPNRLVATLNFMLAVPVGQAIAAGLRALGIVGKGQGGKSREEGAKGKRRAFGRATKSVNMRPLRLYVTLGAAVILLFAFIEPSQSQWAFYDAKEWERIAPVLRFAEQHRDGRYLVENLPFSDLDAAHDGRAINAYLGAQGNEVLSLFFREGAPNVLFLNPLADSLSAQADSYGISSTLVDDSDYFNQSVRQHIEQAKLFGVKYLVMHSPSTKAKLGSVSGVTRYELGQWSVFDLGGAATPTVSTLAYQPALVVSDFSLKLRRRDGYDFMRFAEEQFADNSYDVLLARSPERKIDRLGALDNFGALIIDTYDSDDEAFAFERLREFAQNGLLILLSSDSLLFRRIQSSLAEFPRAEIIERHAEKPGPWLESNGPTRSYGGSEIRRVWRQIRDSLDKHKVTVASQTPVILRSRIEQNRIDINTGAQRTEVPVLLATTYHPNWRRTDDEPIYTATPFFMLTFVKDSAQLVYERRSLDRLGVLVSASALLLLCSVTAWRLRASRAGASKNDNWRFLCSTKLKPCRQSGTGRQKKRATSGRQELWY